MQIRVGENFKRPFIKNVMIMASGAAAAQIISIITIPLITRLYGPEVYGLMGVFLALTFIIVPAAALTFPIAIVLPKSEEDAKGLAVISLFSSTLVSILIAIIIFLFNEQIIEIFKLESISKFLYLIPLVIIFSGFLQVVEQWHIRTKQFTVTAKVEVIQSLLVQGSKLAGGILYPVASVLIFISFSAIGLKASLLNGLSKNTIRLQKIISGKSISYFKELAVKYKDFPLIRTPQTIIFAISESLPILLLASFFGPATAGFYSIGRTVLNLPVQLIGKAIGDVFYPRFAEAAKNGEDLVKIQALATFALAAIGLLPFGVIILYGPWIFSFILGSEWITAGEYARWLAVWLYFYFLNKPSVMALPVLNAQSFHLKYTIFMLFTWISGLAIGYFVFDNDVIAIAIFGVCGALLNIGLIVCTLIFSKNFVYKE